MIEGEVTSPAVSGSSTIVLKKSLDFGEGEPKQELGLVAPKQFL